LSSNSKNDYPGKFVALEYEQRIEPFTGSLVVELIRPFVVDESALKYGIGKRRKRPTATATTTATPSSYWMSDVEQALLQSRPPKQRRQQQQQHDDDAKQQMTIHCVVANGQEVPFPENQFHYCTAHFSGRRRIHDPILLNVKTVSQITPIVLGNPTFIKESFHQENWNLERLYCSTTCRRWYDTTTKRPRKHPLPKLQGYSAQVHRWIGVSSNTSFRIELLLSNCLGAWKRS
jgi:hypothetical protein